jgi:quercetin dioxygenase-like cupin family protein
MAFRVRRIVTGHDAHGKAVVSTDQIIESTAGKIDPTINAMDVWATKSTPPELDGPDPLGGPLPTTPGLGGTMLKLLELPPGTPPLMHKTATLDYVIVLAGEVVMALDNGAEVQMKAGDVVIQRANVHGWANRGLEPCRIAFFLVGAKAVDAKSV